MPETPVGRFCRNLVHFDSSTQTRWEEGKDRSGVYVRNPEAGDLVGLVCGWTKARNGSIIARVLKVQSIPSLPVFTGRLRLCKKRYLLNVIAGEQRVSALAADRVRCPSDALSRHAFSAVANWRTSGSTRIERRENTWRSPIT